MRNFGLLFLLIIVILNSNAQNTSIDNGTGETIFAINSTTIYSYFQDKKVQVTFENGKLIISNTSGSPFLFSTMQPARIYYDNQQLDFKQMNYDAMGDDFILYSPKAHEIGIKSNLPLVKLEKNKIKAVNFYVDGKDIFFAPVSKDKFTSKVDKYFFEIFTNNLNKKYLLKSITKTQTLSHRAPALGLGDENWEKKYKFSTEIRYYILNKDGFYVETKLGKKNILKAIDDRKHETALKKYIKKNKLKLKKAKDVQKLMEYYHYLKNNK